MSSANLDERVIAHLLANPEPPSRDNIGHYDTRFFSSPDAYEAAKEWYALTGEASQRQVSEKRAAFAIAAETNPFLSALFYGQARQMLIRAAAEQCGMREALAATLKEMDGDSLRERARAGREAGVPPYMPLYMKLVFYHRLGAEMASITGETGIRKRTEAEINRIAATYLGYAKEASGEAEKGMRGKTAVTDKHYRILAVPGFVFSSVFAPSRNDEEIISIISRSQPLGRE